MIISEGASTLTTSIESTSAGSVISTDEFFLCDVGCAGLDLSFVELGFNLLTSVLDLLAQYLTTFFFLKNTSVQIQNSVNAFFFLIRNHI